MDMFIQALFWAAVAGLPAALLLKNRSGTTRGWGRGCSCCGNRDICWRGRGAGENREEGETGHD